MNTIWDAVKIKAETTTEPVVLKPGDSCGLS